jgi:hypothetical protein
VAEEDAPGGGRVRVEVVHGRAINRLKAGAMALVFSRRRAHATPTTAAKDCRAGRGGAGVAAKRSSLRGGIPRSDERDKPRLRRENGAFGGVREFDDGFLAKKK